MEKNRKEQIEKIVGSIPTLTNGQLYWLEKVIAVFKMPYTFEVFHSDFIDKQALENFGDALRIHHSFSSEPFSKDKFEYVLEKVLFLSGYIAKLAPKGNRGHDITINGIATSLKTQADKNIRKDKIWISKFMELGKGEWRNKQKDLIGLRNQFLLHMKNYDRILTLRAIERGPQWHYELIELPKTLLLKAEEGKLQMQLKSIQMPKPGYCHVKDKRGKVLFQLYFDGGTERKLQIKNILKENCILHATWRFTMPNE
jgi:hypothetical protein